MKPTNRRELLKTFPKHSVGAEIGVFAGKFTGMIFEEVKPRVVYAVDCWDKYGEYRSGPLMRARMQKFARLTAAHAATGRLRILCGLSVEMAVLIPEQSLDWVYIDADHHYDAVLADLMAWWRKLKVGAICSGHDYCSSRTGVAHAVSDFRAVNGIHAPLGITFEDWPSWYFIKESECSPQPAG